MHPNDMTHWDAIGCRRGCIDHVTIETTVNIGGPTPYRDLTSIPERFATEFTIEVWDTSKAPVDGGPYCPARDAVSETILALGIWEPQETTILLECFERTGPGVFVDFGAQIGWFSVLARQAGMQVLAFEADPDCHRVATRNVGGGVNLTRVDADSTPFDPMHWEMPVVVKIDLEGAEQHAIAMLQPAIDAGKVEFVMAEISPCFNDSYPKLVAGLMRDGFIGYMLPDKQMPPVQIDQLEALIPYQLPKTQAAAKREVETWAQRDVLFVRGGL